MIEAIKAVAVLAVLLVGMRVAGVDRWFLAGLSAFIALWAIQVGIHLYRATRRRVVLIAFLVGACGAAAAAAMQIFWERQTVSLITGAAAVVLIAAWGILTLVARASRATGAESSPGDHPGGPP